jgi:hypothetical protein
MDKQGILPFRLDKLAGLQVVGLLLCQVGVLPKRVEGVSLLQPVKETLEVQCSYLLEVHQRELEAALLWSVEGAVQDQVEK